MAPPSTFTIYHFTLCFCHHVASSSSEVKSPSTDICGDVLSHPDNPRKSLHLKILSYINRIPFCWWRSHLQVLGVRMWTYLGGRPSAWEHGATDHLQEVLFMGKWELQGPGGNPSYQAGLLGGCPGKSHGEWPWTGGQGWHGFMCVSWFSFSLWSIGSAVIWYL